MNAHKLRVNSKSTLDTNDDLSRIFSQGTLKYCFYLIAIFSAVLITINTAQAAPCFDNAKNAYLYLVAQEKSEVQARDQALVNINRATESELVSLQGIGSRKAQEIILYRDMFGAFKTVDELAKVKGIGVKTIEKNRSRLSVNY